MARNKRQSNKNDKNHFTPYTGGIRPDLPSEKFEGSYTNGNRFMCRTHQDTDKTDVSKCYAIQT